MVERRWYERTREPEPSKMAQFGKLVGVVILIGAVAFAAVQLNKRNSSTAVSETGIQSLEDRRAENDVPADESATTVGTPADDAQVTDEPVNREADEVEVADETGSRTEDEVKTVDEPIDSAENESKKAGEIEMQTAAQTPIVEPVEPPATEAKENEPAQQTYATIESEQSFVACERLEDLRPVNPNSSFAAGPVYIWAQVKVPRSESIRLRWLTVAGEDLGSKTIDVEESPTYRIWDYRLCEPGSYVVELYDSQNKLLAKRKFTVTD